MNKIWQDLRYATRMLAKNPGFTAVAVITLALGIGANTAIFSVVNGVLLRSLTYPEADRLVVIYETSEESEEIAVTYPNYLDWRAQQTVFEDMFARMPAGGIITGAGEPERVIGRLVTASFFNTLGVHPALGRSFTEDEDRPGAERVMVISFGLWQRRFGGEPEVIGRAINYNGESWTVVGVMPDGFDFYGRTNLNNDFFMPLGRLSDQEYMRDRNSHTVQVAARLKRGVNEEQARSEMKALAARLETEHPASNTGRSATLSSFLDDYVGESRTALIVILGAVALVLLIACANVANLMLARATARQKEMAVRLALGATRARIARQLMTESLLLAVVGGAIGVLVATWGIDLLIRFNPESLPRLDEITIDSRVLAFTLLVTLLTSIVFGLAPALQSSKANLTEALKKGGRGSSVGATTRLRRLLVAVEVALSLVLLVGAGLLVKSFSRLMEVDPGYDPKNVLTMRLRLPDAKYRESSQTLAFCRETMSRVAALPGVECVSVTTGFPLGRHSGENGYWIEGQPEPQLPGEWPVAITQAVSEDYHKALGISLLEGRRFTDQDTETSSLVVLVDEEFARRHFQDQPLNEVIGKQLCFGGDRVWREIVGVVRHIHHNGLDEERGRAQIYRPWTQIAPRWLAEFTRAMDLVVKTSVEPMSLVAAIKQEIRTIDKDQPIAQVQTLEDRFARSLAPRKFNLFVLLVFALIALSLASVGIYGVVSYTVACRTREIGIRSALGARTANLLRLVIFQGMTSVLVGVALGIIGAFALTRLMSSLLFEVSATDSTIFLLTPVILAAVALGACFAPALKAAKIDPLIALRHE